MNFSVKELSEMFNKSESFIRVMIEKTEVPVIREAFRSSGAFYHYITVSEDYIPLFEDFIENSKPFAKNGGEVVKVKKPDIAELRRLHPLVTNDKFFNDSYFPA